MKTTSAQKIFVFVGCLFILHCSLMSSSKKSRTWQIGLFPSHTVKLSEFEFSLSPITIVESDYIKFFTLTYEEENSSVSGILDFSVCTEQEEFLKAISTVSEEEQKVLINFFSYGIKFPLTEETKTLIDKLKESSLPSCTLMYKTQLLSEELKLIEQTIANSYISLSQYKGKLYVNKQLIFDSDQQAEDLVLEKYVLLPKSSTFQKEKVEIEIEVPFSFQELFFEKSIPSFQVVESEKVFISSYYFYMLAIANFPLALGFGLLWYFSNKKEKKYLYAFLATFLCVLLSFPFLKKFSEPVQLLSYYLFLMFLSLELYLSEIYSTLIQKARLVLFGILLLLLISLEFFIKENTELDMKIILSISLFNKAWYYYFLLETFYVFIKAKRWLLLLASFCLSLIVTLSDNFSNLFFSLSSTFFLFYFFMVNISRKERDYFKIKELYEAQQFEMVKELEVKFERIQKDLDLAHRIQGLYLKPVEIQTNWFSVYGVSHPSKELGGDFFAINFSEDGNLLYVGMGDVSGKGTGSALVMSSIHSLMKENFRKTMKPNENLESINWSMQKLLTVERRSKNKIFCTANSLLFQNNSSKEIQLYYSNAGHLSVLYKSLWPRSQSTELFEKGLPLGVVLNPKYSLVTQPFYKSTFILLYSDGVIEQTNLKGEQYGLHRLKEALKSSNLKPKETINQILEDIAFFSQGIEQQDDITVVGIALYIGERK